MIIHICVNLIIVIIITIHQILLEYLIIQKNTHRARGSGISSASFLHRIHRCDCSANLKEKRHNNVVKETFT